MAAALATHTHPTWQHPAHQAHPRGTETMGAAPQDAGLQELVCEPPASFITNTPQDSSLGVWYYLLPTKPVPT